MTRDFRSLALAAVVALCGAACKPPEPPKLLFLSKSSGFQHSSITRKYGELSHVEKIVQALAEKYGAEVTLTKDASLINAENLKNYDVVVFYTTGDLTKPGTDEHPPMGENGVAELIDWIKAGGGFMGFHCATDTFHDGTDGPPSPYTQMIGASFRAHGQQFEGTVQVVDREHAAMESVPTGWKIKDEWYLFRNLDTANIHVLALLDPGEERERQEMYNIPSYPIIWCREFGEGRIYYNAMGHREDVWDNETFQLAVLDAAQWAMGAKGRKGDSPPNYDQVVPTEIK